MREAAVKITLLSGPSPKEKLSRIVVLGEVTSTLILDLLLGVLTVLCNAFFNSQGILLTLTIDVTSLI